MATLAGELLIKMGLDVAQLKRDTAESNRMAKEMAGNWQAAAGIAKAGLAGLAAAISFDKIAAEFHKATSALSALDDAAEIAGTSVENLSSLLGVATEAGVGLSGLTDVMQKLTKATLGVEQESSKAAEAWKALKINPRDFDDASELLMAVAKGFDGFADGARKAELAQALLGKAGQQALPLLKDLAERGTEQSRVTSEMAAEAERLEKQWARLSYEGDVFKQTVASKIIPALADLVMQFNKARAAGLSFFEALNTIPGPGMDKAGQIKMTEGQLAEAQARLDRAQARAGKGGDLAGLFSKREIEEATKDVAKYTKELEVFRSQKADLQKREPALMDVYGFGNRPGRPDAPSLGDKDKRGEDIYKKQADAIAEMQRNMLKVGDATMESLMVFETTQGKYKEFDKATKSTLVTLGAQADLRKRELADAEKLAAIENAIAESNKEILKAKEAQAKADEDAVDAALKATATNIQEEKSRQQKALDERFLGGAITEKQHKEATEILQGLKKETKEVKDIWEQLGATFESAFEKAIDAGGNFGDFMAGLGKDLTKILMREFVTGPLITQFKALLTDIKKEMQSVTTGSGGATPSFSGGSVWGLITGLAGTLGGILGPKDPGGSYSEGNYQTSAPITINIDSRTDSAVVAQNVQQGVEKAMAGVADARMRGSAAYA